MSQCRVSTSEISRAAYRWRRLCSLDAHYSRLPRFEHLLGHDHLTDLHRAPCNLSGLDGAVECVDLHIPHEAHPPKDLDALVAAQLDSLRRRHVRRGRHLMNLAAASTPRLNGFARGQRLVHQQLRARVRRVHARELVLDELERANGLAELHALLGPLHSEVDGALGGACTADRDPCALEVQAGHHDSNPAVLSTEHVLDGHVHVLEDELGLRTSTKAHLVLFLADAESRHPLLDKEGAHTLVALLGRRFRVHEDDVRHRAVGDP
mmetsp:Transcript_53139/g.119265  ORF Transcript_53139/g.119265 Transcript_53139/m.119265 type:complete len:265 (-) Transcript_53139:24-818(-)